MKRKDAEKIIKTEQLISYSFFEDRGDATDEMVIKKVSDKWIVYATNETIVCSALILKCLEEGLYPSWDAQSMNSVRLAESLGYEYDHDYIAYEVANDLRTH